MVDGVIDLDNIKVARCLKLIISHYVCVSISLVKEIWFVRACHLECRMFLENLRFTKNSIDMYFKIDEG